MSCKHEEVYPDGTCTNCGVLATVFPGKVEEHHKMVPWPKAAADRLTSEAAAAGDQLKHRFVRVMVCSPDGDYLEDLQVCYEKSADAGSFSDEENVGSRGSELRLVDRIRRHVAFE